MKINGLDFFCTCSACPEQYDVTDENGNMVGYVRLRWGGLSCEYPWVGGEVIYTASIGDGWTGCFESEHQRTRHLTKVAKAIRKKLNTEVR